MEVVNTLDIDGTQWEIQDVKASKDIGSINTKLSQIIKNVFNGFSIFDVFMKYLGEDNDYIYYNFWWETKAIEANPPVTSISVVPTEPFKDKIICLNMNILQTNNASIIQATQHWIGPNKAGILTYIENASDNKEWFISGMGILRRVK